MSMIIIAKPGGRVHRYLIKKTFVDFEFEIYLVVLEFRNNLHSYSIGEVIIEFINFISSTSSSVILTEGSFLFIFIARSGFVQIFVR